MKKNAYILIITLFLTNILAFSVTPDDGWNNRKDLIKDVGGKLVYKQDEVIRFTFYDSIDMPTRVSAMGFTKKYLEECLLMLQEKELKDSIDIIFVRNRADMVRFLGIPFSGITITDTDEYFKQKTIICIWASRNPLKHEIMHLVSLTKWGGVKDSNQLSWVVEGLATYAAPEAECDSYSLEEKYIYFLQSKKLISADSLINDFDRQHNKISYNQSACIVKYLIRNFGIEKLRKLWINGMSSFMEIYGLSLDNMMKQIEKTLSQQSPAPIDFDWSEFDKSCY